MQHLPRKRFGQNFLVDQNIVSKILSALDPASEDNLVEIGPGLAALTKPLAVRKLRIHAIEIDRDIAAQLKTDLPPENVVIHNQDALGFDFSGLGTRLRVFGNLPYNISTPLLFHLISYVDSIQDIHVMLQKEVVERITAESSTAEYGRLSVMLQYHFYTDRLFDVSPQCFRPAPKVISSFVRLTPKPGIKMNTQEYALFSELVTKAFGQRRKMLGNALKPLLNKHDFAALGVDDSSRAENITLEGFIAITEYLSSKKG